jgi:chaperonin cofactor prefoldin
MVDENNLESFEKQIQDLRAELTKFREDTPKQLQNDIQTERVRRAEKHTEYMRNWLGLLSLIVTILFVAFGILGIRSYLDVRNFRTQMEADAGDVSVKKNEVDDAAAKVGQLTAGLEERVKTLDTKLAELEKRYELIQTQFTKIETDVRGTKVGVQQNYIDNSNLRSNLKGLAGADPIILEAPTAVGEKVSSLLGGKNFGKAPGHLLVLVQTIPSILSQSLSTSSSQIEIKPSSIGVWTDTSISFELSSADNATIRDIAAKGQQVSQYSVLQSSTYVSAFLSFAVENSSGKISGWSSTVMWPTLVMPAIPSVLPPTQSPIWVPPSLNAPTLQQPINPN